MTDPTRHHRLPAEAGFSLVELLVVISLLAIIGTAITNVVLSTQRTQQYAQSLREVMDDARVSLDRVERELRQARLVYADFTCGGSTCTTSSRLHFWVDHDQDNLRHVTENVFYCIQVADDIGYEDKCVEPTGGRYALIRWTGEADGTGTSSPPRILAVTLTNSAAPFTFDTSPRETRLVTVDMTFDTGSARGPSTYSIDTTVRLRNVA